MERTTYTEAMVAYQSWLLSCHMRRVIHESHNLCCEQLPLADEHGEIIGYIPPLYENGDSLERMAENLEKLALESCFLAFSDVLDKAYGDKKRYTSPLRAIVFMFRCVSAHTPIAPAWNITNRHYRQKYSIKEKDLEFEIDFSNMPNRKVTIEDFGGMKKLWPLMNYCLSVIKSKEKKL